MELARLGKLSIEKFCFLTAVFNNFRVSIDLKLFSRSGLALTGFNFLS